MNPAPAEAVAPIAAPRPGVDIAARGPWIQTFTGRRFYLLDPRPEDVDIRDIAHHLSLVNRWTGATRTAFSVAQHSVMVSWRVDARYALAALLHDAKEAYTGDLSTPLKRALRCEQTVAVCAALKQLGVRDDGGTVLDALEIIEDRIDRAIYAAFGLPWIEVKGYAKIIKHADMESFATERRDLLNVPRADAGFHDWAPCSAAPMPGTIVPVAAEIAERAFLERFEQLTALRPDKKQDSAPLPTRMADIVGWLRSVDIECSVTERGQFTLDGYPEIMRCEVFMCRVNAERAKRGARPFLLKL